MTGMSKSKSLSTAAPCSNKTQGAGLNTSGRLAALGPPSQAFLQAAFEHGESTAAHRSTSSPAR